jgi:hypothetical protein
MQPVIDTTKAHSARVYDYYLGGKDHFAADRETAQKAMRSWGAVRTAVRENRAFLGRAVRYLVAEAGIRQFLDIGTGLPSADNVHEVAQAATPESRVVYVNNDPIVLAHARALLTSTTEGRTAYIHADLREPEQILASPAVAETLDLSRPAALMLVAILHFLTDADDPAGVVATLLGALAPGQLSGRVPRHARARPRGGGRARAHLPAGRHPGPGQDRRRVRGASLPRAGDDRARRGARLGVAPSGGAEAAARRGQLVRRDRAHDRPRPRLGRRASADRLDEQPGGAGSSRCAGRPGVVVYARDVRHARIDLGPRACLGA